MRPVFEERQSNKKPDAKFSCQAQRLWNSVKGWSKAVPLSAQLQLLEKRIWTRWHQKWFCSKPKIQYKFAVQCKYQRIQDKCYGSNGLSATFCCADSLKVHRHFCHCFQTNAHVRSNVKRSNSTLKVKVLRTTSNGHHREPWSLKTQSYHVVPTYLYYWLTSMARRINKTIILDLTIFFLLNWWIIEILMLKSNSFILHLSKNSVEAFLFFVVHSVLLCKTLILKSDHIIWSG